MIIEKRHFGVTEVKFFEKNHHSTGKSTQNHKIQNFLANGRVPKSKKQVQRYYGFAKYYRNYIPRLSEKLLGFKDTSTKILWIRQILPQLHTSTCRKNYSINAALAEAWGLALKQPITGRQYAFMTNASFRVSGYALMIEEDNEKKN